LDAVPGFDLFISYRRLDAERVRPLVAALQARGVSVWLDQQTISEFAPITAEIRNGLAQSKALLAWYSDAYPQSRPCQMELTAALLCRSPKLGRADTSMRRRREAVAAHRDVHRAIVTNTIGGNRSTPRARPRIRDLDMPTPTR
jgi:hypothetical protein